MKTNRILLGILVMLTNIAAQSQIPRLSSNLAAAATIYLDFDGEYVTGTAWNWGGPITAQPASLITPDGITEIFNRVAEDYRIFNVNVTTDSSVFLSVPFEKRLHVIITPSSSWYGNAGGVAYVGSYSWADGTPVWVFSNKLGHNIKYIAEACAHEAGHALGLQHQSTYNSSCQKTAEYAGGQGSGEIGWAPIMGVGYYKNLTTWHNGTNSSGCNELQNDIDIIAGPENGFGLRTDDHGDTHTTATAVSLSQPMFSMSGIVNKSADKDVFELKLTHAQNLKLTAIPQNVGAGNSGADVDIKVSLLNDAGDTIGRYNPSLLLNAGIDTNLLQGTYYVVAEGVDNPNLGDYGSVGYYSVNGALNSVLAAQRIRLTGVAKNGEHSLSWNYTSGDDVKNFEVQVSQNGHDFEKLVSLNAADRSMSYNNISEKKLFYRVRAIAPDERSSYSNTLALQNMKQGSAVQVINTLVKGWIGVNSTGIYQYQLMQQNGQLLQQGTLTSGYNKINVKPGIKGLLMIRIYDNNNQWTTKLMLE
jgi:hypothetical protein